MVGAWSHEAGGGRFFNVIAIKQMYPGHAKQVGHATATVHAGAYANRYVVVVDDDIDPTDTTTYANLAAAYDMLQDYTKEIGVLKKVLM